VKSFNVCYLPLVLVVAAAGCNRTRTDGHDGPHSSASVSAVSSAVCGPKPGGVTPHQRIVTASPGSAPGAPAEDLDPPTPIPVAAPLTLEAPPTVVAAVATAEEGAVKLPAPVALADAAPPFSDSAGDLTPNTVELGEGELDGLVLSPGVYAWSTGVSIPADITLAGDSDDVWVFQIASNLAVADGASVLLSGGAQASNVLWLVAGRATLGAGAMVEGTIRSPVPISMMPGAVVTGRSPARDVPSLHATVVKVP
jgi:hypothetical protein